MVGNAAETLPYQPGTTLSLYPGATQTKLLELLAAIVLFVVARHSLASPARLKRMAWVLVINGCLLSIFALIQKVRGPEYTIYGMHVAGEAFGPFINRNHFASYVNFSICLGMGLFLAVMQRNPRSYAIHETGQRMPLSYATGAWSEILQHPQAVWLLIPLAVCLTAVFASLSRGGILAIVVAIGMAALAWRRQGSAKSLVGLVIIPLIALVLLIWYGAAPTLERLEQSQITSEGRFTIWQASWEAIRRFPVLGTGLGTFSIVEPLYRPIGCDQTITHDHAHNEYIEALVEGGIVRFAITAALIWLVLRHGWRALQARQRTGDKALILGGWSACIALAVQSFGEFGVHLPAVASALAVTAGYLVALGGSRPSSSEDPSLIRWHYFGIGPVLGFSFATSLGLILFAGSWLNWQSEAWRENALQIRQEANGNPAQLKKAVDRLDVAIYYGPAYSRVRMERNDIEDQRLLMLENLEREVLQKCLIAQQAARLTLGMNHYPVDALNTFAEDVMQPYLAQLALSKQLSSRLSESWKKQQVHLIAARDLCPLAWQPHLKIAEHVVPAKAVLASSDQLMYWKESDPMQAYLQRIKLLHPHRAETWFFCGHQEGIAGNREEAIKSWRTSLELSDEFLSPIMQECRLSVLQPELKLNMQEIMDQLIPPGNANYYVKAAWILYPGQGEARERKPYMEKAISILEKKHDILSSENQFTYGLALWGVDQREQGLPYLVTAIRAQPGKITWRLDLARLYFELEKYSDAREQAEMILRAQPGNLEATELLNKLDAVQRPTK